MNIAVLKIGGSLALHPQKLKTLCTKLSEASKNNAIVVVPGGGEFADTVRKLDKRFHLSAETSHRMAILGMDQYGLLLSNLTPISRAIDEFERVQEVLDSSELPIFLPSKFFSAEDPLDNSWDVTSDSIAAFIASHIKANKVVLVTDVDGVYASDPKTHPNAKLIDKIPIKEFLASNRRTSVDRFLPKLISQSKIECFVVNGLFPERVLAILDGKNTVCTRIK
jgi:5-(aminomethyl)-3-furanmethanol phosphate kinase